MFSQPARINDESKIINLPGNLLSSQCCCAFEGPAVASSWLSFCPSFFEAAPSLPSWLPTLEHIHRSEAHVACRKPHWLSPSLPLIHCAFLCTNNPRDRHLLNMVHFSIAFYDAAAKMLKVHCGLQSPSFLGPILMAISILIPSLNSKINHKFRSANFYTLDVQDTELKIGNLIVKNL